MAECLTQCGMPQPVAVIRQTIRDLLLRDARVSEGGIVLNRRFWRRFAEKGTRRASAGLVEECRERMKSDASSMYLAPLWSWLIGECRRFCQATGRDSLSEADREVLLQAFDELDWKALGSLGRNRWPWLRKICDILGGGSVTPVPGPAVLNALPRDGPIPADVNAFARGLAAEFLQRVQALGEDFEVHDLYAVCPNGKRLNRKPNIFVRGSNEQWRYQAKGTDCCGCPLRAQCTQGKGPKILCVNVYRKDLALHAKRMKADPQETRDLMGRHRAMSEGMVNNLMNHQGIRYAYWKGLALARLQAGLAIVMSNVLKWHKLRHGRLVPMTLKPAA